MLSAFVITQIALDVVLVALVVYLVTRPAPPPPGPPEWYGQMVKLAQDMMAATEPVLERMEKRPEPAAAPMPDHYAEARTLLRAGASSDVVAGRAGLRPGEVRLLASVVAAERARGRA